MDARVVARFESTLPADDDHPYRTGPWRPNVTEWHVRDCDVVGELPADLNGVYLRNTENPLHPALGRYHPFDGDGMLHAVEFGNGRRRTATASSARPGSRPSWRPAARCGPGWPSRRADRCATDGAPARG